MNVWLNNGMLYPTGVSSGVWAPTLTTVVEPVFHALPLESPAAPVASGLPIVLMAPLAPTGWKRF